MKYNGFFLYFTIDSKLGGSDKQPANRAHPLSNAYRHSLNPAIPFRCDFIEKLVPLILTKQPDFFSGEL